MAQILIDFDKRTTATKNKLNQKLSEYVKRSADQKKNSKPEGSSKRPKRDNKITCKSTISEKTTSTSNPINQRVIFSLVRILDDLKQKIFDSINGS